jgi:hypothetical protein
VKPEAVDFLLVFDTSRLSHAEIEREYSATVYRHGATGKYPAELFKVMKAESSACLAEEVAGDADRADGDGSQNRDGDIIPA